MAKKLFFIAASLPIPFFQIDKLDYSRMENSCPSASWRRDFGANRQNSHSICFLTGKSCYNDNNPAFKEEMPWAGIVRLSAKFITLKEV
jgi:hypothetical protein